MSNVKSNILKIRKHLLLTIIFLLVFFSLYYRISRSLFIKKTDRVNLVVYGKEPVVYSLGLKDKVNYLIQFYPDLKVKIPGGYGYYRLGGLGKLVNLEKNPFLFKKTFSHITSSFVNYYFFSDSREIFYGVNQDNQVLREGINLFILFKLKSNASFFDRLFLLNFLLGKRSQDFVIINSFYSFLDQKNNFMAENFLEKYQGYFYQPLFREEKQNIQLIYSKNYQTAKMLGNIIEGNGIRVVDISQKEQKDKDCLIIENNEQFSQTAQVLAEFFQCRLKKAKPELSDIIMYINNKEGEWEVN